LEKEPDLDYSSAQKFWELPEFAYVKPIQREREHGLNCISLPESGGKKITDDDFPTREPE